MSELVSTGSASSAGTGAALRKIIEATGLSVRDLAWKLGASHYSVQRWIEGTASPSPETATMIDQILAGGLEVQRATANPFESAGRKRPRAGAQNELFDGEITLTADPSRTAVLEAVARGDVFTSDEDLDLLSVLNRHRAPSITANCPPVGGMSAGKNTYTYDAHTYHTKVPPQGIAELIRHYLPNGGLLLDPFAGSGMTGVAASVVGVDAVLNELSPAACFISSQFNSRVSPESFRAALRAVLEATAQVRADLYSTSCRECGESAEILYTVWSYRVTCPDCSGEFNVWDECRSYGRTVREHKILKEFPCPHCSVVLKKAKLQRLHSEPVELGYMCCGSRQKERTHPLTEADIELIKSLERGAYLASGFFPTDELPDGVNLGQPRRHGITSIDQFYTPRNLAALSSIWKAICSIEQPVERAAMGFVFTSLYQRVTRLSEFRFWGGSGNMARFNVPFISNEANVFRTFERKARTIEDHIATTAQAYSGDVVTLNGSATNLSRLPDGSVDFIFTDPPFGANINYSEMNILWESWLGRFTDPTDEVIVNRSQAKTVEDYGRLMKESMEECFRVLRPGHWMLVVFMNSSAKVWATLQNAIEGAGFSVVSADVFDKQHGTFKQFVSPNTPGADLVLHCIKPVTPAPGSILDREDPIQHLRRFLASRDQEEYVTTFLHVQRDEELDFRRLFAEWTAELLLEGGVGVDFDEFRRVAEEYFDVDRRP